MLWTNDLPKSAIIVSCMILIVLLVWQLWTYARMVFEELKKENSTATGAEEEKKTKKEV